MFLVTKLGYSALVVAIIGGGVTIGTKISQQLSSSIPVKSEFNSKIDLTERELISSSAESPGTSASDPFPQVPTIPLTVSEVPETVTLSTPIDIPPEGNHLTNTREEQLEETVQQVENGNCRMIDSLEHIFKTEEQKEVDYYSIFCEDVGKDLDIPNKFEGAFPKSIFKGNYWNKDKKLDIKVKLEAEDMFAETDPAEEDSDYIYGITFSSEQFANNSQFNGKLKYHDFDSVENNTRSGAIVKLNHPEINQYIYLDWEDYK